ncbi:MAG: nitronate monooxygenase, partial [Pseudonocardia sp.]|nr:nitronate monooxygenase [Pseudonocardia sp.]
AWLVASEYALGVPASATQRALLAAGSSDTVRSRIYTGKPARLLKTRWTQAWAAPDAPAPLPMPLQNLLVSEAHQRMARADDPNAVAMPVGQIVGRMNRVRPVAELMDDLLAELGDTLARLDRLR